MSRQERTGKCRAPPSIQGCSSLIHMRPVAGPLAGAANLIKQPARGEVLWRVFLSRGGGTMRHGCVVADQSVRHTFWIKTGKKEGEVVSMTFDHFCVVVPESFNE